MPGKRGKRSKPRRPCGRCDKKIEGNSFYRTTKADYCPACFEQHVVKEQSR